MLLVLLGGSSAWAQLTGTKAIPGDYASLSAAITDLNTAGVGAGGVTFNVAAGYTETAANLLITATGTAANPIVIQKSGAGANPVITAAAGTNANSSTTTLDAIIKLRGTDYLTLDGLTLVDPAANTGSAQMEFGVVLYRASNTDGCQNVTIRNCSITLQRGNTGTGAATSIGIFSSASTELATAVLSPTGATAAGQNSNNKFYGNTIQNVNTGIYLLGLADATPYANFDQGNDVGGNSAATGNSITNYGGTASTTSYGIRTNYQNGLNSSYNTLGNAANGGVAGASTLYGIFHQSGSTNASLTVNNNAVTLSQAGNSSQVAGIATAAGGTGSTTINNNTFAVTTATGNSSTIYAVLQSGSQAGGVTMNGNTFNNTGNTVAGSGSLYFLSCDNATNNITAQNNTFSNLSKTVSGGTVYTYYNNGSPTGGTMLFSGNTISTITLTGSTTFYGLYVNSSASQTQTVTNNSVSNITGGSSSVYGLAVNYGATGSVISGNTVSGLTSTGTLYGIYTNTNLNGVNISQNTVSGLSTTSSSVYGLYVSGGTGTQNWFRNKVYNLASSSTSASVNGFYISSGPTVTNFNNNLIGDLRAPAATGSNAINGIYVGSGTNVNVHFNTVYLNATSSSTTTFGTSGVYAASTTPVLDLRNNIVVNLSVPGATGGATAALRYTAAPGVGLASTTNNNLYYAGTPAANRVIYVEGTSTLANAQQTLSAYISYIGGGRETASVTENPTFLSTTGTDATFLHLNPTVPTLAEGRAQAISGITTDFDGETRNASTPDIGADEGTFTPGGSALDVAASGLAAPLGVGCYGAAENVTVTIRNNGTQTLNFATNPVTVTAAVSGAATQTFTVTVNTGTLAPAGTRNVVLGTLNMTATGTYTFAVSATTTGDGDTSNDNLTTTRTVVPVAALPQTVNFTGFTGSNLTTVFPNWYEATGATAPVAGNSVWVSATGVGTATNVTAKINLYTTTRNEWIVGPKITATAATRLQFRGALTDFGSTTSPAGANDGFTGTDDAVRVMVSTDCGVTFTEVFRVDATNQPSPTTIAFVEYTVPLGAYAGQNIIVAFKATDGPNDDLPDYDFHLDDVALNEAAASDAGITALTEPGTTGCYGATQNVTVTIRNYGTADLTNVPVRVVVGGALTQTLNGTFTGTIAANGTANFTVGQVNMTAAGTYTFDASTQLTGDANAANDALAQQSRTITAVAAQGQTLSFTGFSGSNLSTLYPGWTEATGATAPTGTTGAWATGTFPTGNTTAKVNLYDLGKNDWIVSPKFLATAATVLTFDAGISDFAGTTPDPAGMTGTDDIVEVRISTDCGASFVRIPTFAQFNASNQPSNGSLTSYSINLGSYAGQQIIVAFFASEGTVNDGPDYDFHIDNVRVNSPVAIDLAATALVTPVATQSCYSNAETVTVTVRNEGTQALNFATNPATVSVVVTTPGGTQTLTAAINTGTLASGATQNVTLATPLDMSAVGTYSFALTGTVQGDLNTSNDALTPAVTRTVVAPVAGTVTPAARNLCVSGTVALTLTGAANGSIQWQQSTDNVTFTNVAGATSATYTTPVLTQAMFYRAQVSCGTQTATSNVAAITVSNPLVASTNSPVAVCSGNTATLTATAATGTSLRFFDALTGGTALATGTSFTTPALTASRQYFVEAFNATTESVGRTAPTSTSSTTALNYGLVFTAANAFTLNSVDVYPNGAAGNLVVQVQDNTGTLIPGLTATVAVPTGTGTTAFTVPLNFNIPAGTGMRLIAVSSPSLVRESTGATFPYTTPSGNVSITGGYISGASTTYYFFYNWQIAAECVSASRTAIQVNVTTPATADFSYAAASYCTSATAAATPTLGTGATAGTFSSTSGLTLNATTGAITPATSTPGTYTVTNTVAAAGGCGAVTSTTTVTITAP
ncbi:hypothetical protein F0P96_11040, partial [Hymenobacter busanensis]